MSKNNHMKYWKRFHGLVMVLVFGILINISGFDSALGQDGPQIKDENVVAQVLSDKKDVDENLLSIQFTNITLRGALEILAEEINIGFSYNPDIMPDKKVSFEMTNAPAHEVIYKLLEGTNLEPVLPQSKDVIIIREKEDFNEIIQELVTGTVVDAQSGETLPGVTISVKDTNIGTATDVDGEFELSVPSLYDILIFSSIGYQSQEVPIDGRSDLEVGLEQEVYTGEELVVVGYGVQRRSDITGSVGMVAAADLEQPTFNALQSLRGKVAGVNIFSNSGAPTGSNRVIIRGVGSINASSDPLYVVDGLVMDNIDMMNPNDIESIEVLKDASATAIYGARGANGVILVTTERGASGEGAIIKYSGNMSVGKMRGRMDAMNSEEFMEVQQIGIENAPLFSDYDTGEEPVYAPSDPRLFDSNGNPLYDTDWQKEATRTAISHDHQFSIQSGNENSSVGAFLNFTDNEGILLNSYMQRVNLKLVYDVKPNEWFSFGTNLSVNRTWENNIEEGGGGQEARRTMIEMPPIFPVTWSDGTYSNSTQINGFTFEGQANPVHRLLEEDRLRDRIRLFGNTFMAFQILENLEFRTQIGINTSKFEARNYGPTNLIAGGFPDGNASITNTETTYWQNENFLTYIEEFDAHRINTVLGASWQQNLSRGSSLSARGFSDDFFKYNNIATATDSDPPTSFAEDWTMNSYFTRASYTYDDTYMLTFTARVDGSSRFGENSKYGFFPSAGAAWLVSNEEFMSGINFVDHLRLRSSYGITGNTEIGLYNSLATIGSGTTLIGGTRRSSSFVQRMPNPELEWEKTRQFNIGAELNLFNEVLSLEGDYYYKFTSDLLLDRPIPSTTGFSSILDNIGSLSNRGIDFMITTRNISTSDLFWSTTLNFNFNKNRVESLGAEDEDIFPGPNWVSGSQTILRVGEPIGNFYGFERIGTWGTDEEAEAAAAGRIPGEAKRSENRMIIGNGLPDWTGSFINRFNYRNFDFMADFQFVFGVDIMQQFLHTAEDRQALTNGISTQFYNAWTEENQNTMYQRIRHQPLSGQNTQADSHWIVNGSYLRGNLFRLGYTLNQELVNSFGVQQLRFTASLENAFVIHSNDFKGHDPEATSWGGNLHAQNIFFYQYPKPRTFSLGVNMRF